MMLVGVVVVVAVAVGILMVGREDRGRMAHHRRRRQRRRRRADAAPSSIRRLAIEDRAPQRVGRQGQRRRPRPSRRSDRRRRRRRCRSAGASTSSAPGAVDRGARGTLPGRDVLQRALGGGRDDVLLVGVVRASVDAGRPCVGGGAPRFDVLHQRLEASDRVHRRLALERRRRARYAVHLEGAVEDGLSDDGGRRRRRRERGRHGPIGRRGPETVGARRRRALEAVRGVLRGGRDRAREGRVRGANGQGRAGVAAAGRHVALLRRRQGRPSGRGRGPVARVRERGVGAMLIRGRVEKVLQRFLPAADRVRRRLDGAEEDRRGVRRRQTTGLAQPPRLTVLLLRAAGLDGDDQRRLGRVGLPVGVVLDGARHDGRRSVQGHRFVIALKMLRSDRADASRPRPRRVSPCACRRTAIGRWPDRPARR